MAPLSEIPTTMRAMIRRAYGSPKSLRLASGPVPVPVTNEVLVRVVAAGIDAGTWHLITGMPYLARAIGFGLRAPKNPVPGLAFAGGSRQWDPKSRASGWVTT
jgi:NADPH:quinone reductase-like Zn-dependent oxidoreductase